LTPCAFDTVHALCSWHSWHCWHWWHCRHPVNLTLLTVDL